MNVENNIVDLIYLIRRQFPDGITTWANCQNKCGNTARGGGECVECLIKELGCITSEEVANNWLDCVKKEYETRKKLFA